MRFYGVSDQDCLKMPYRRMLGLSREIRTLQIEEEVRAVLIANQSKPKEFLRDLHNELRERTGGRAVASNKPIEINHVITQYEASDGAIAVERRRQEQAAARLDALRAEHGGTLPPDIILAELAKR